MSPPLNWQQHGAEANWEAGRLNEQLKTEGSSQRLKGSWREKKRTLRAIYDELRPRVDACWQQSVGVQVCNALGEQLHKAMKDAPVEDLRLSVAGEKHRILTRALAMREVLRVQDPTLGATQVRAEEPANSHKARCPVTPMAHGGQQQQQGSRVVTMQRSSNEADPDAAPDQCVLAVCMLMAALYEQTPWGEGSDLRKRVFSDFTYLKRHFRQDELQMMYGRTGSAEELFEAVKALDRTSGLQNLLGLVFEDWKVNQRVDPFILGDALEVEVLTLTSDGPIGKFKCKLRTLITLGLLHQRLLKELYAGIFADRSVSNKQWEPMTSTDSLDFVDFTEAVGRNLPHKHVDGSNLYYAWMYAPEVHAAPEVWQQVFGPGANKLPTLFDGVTTPDDAACITGKDGDYALDIHTAATHDFLAQGSAQAAVGFPWADDLIGAYLRKLRQERSTGQPQPPAARTNSGSGSVGGASSSSPVLMKQEGQGPGTLAPSVKQEEGGGTGIKLEPPQQQQQQPLLQQPVLEAAGSMQPPQQLQGSQVHPQPPQPPLQGPMRPSRKLEMSSRQAWSMRARLGSQWAPPSERISRRMTGQGMAPRVGKKQTPTPFRHDQPRASPYAQGGRPTPTPRQSSGGGERPEVARIPDADETGKLVLPLGIFMVGLIVSGAFTNTQVHVEDLLLMSININMFGAPKVWWWIPQESVQAFKEAAELMTEGGRGELYTKSISPFLTDREHPGHPEQVLPLERLKELGAKRTIQLPGMGIWTMPGYAFHFTVSMGMNVAESCNMFLELMGWTFDKLWMARPVEQYPEPEDDMSRYMRETGLLRRLGVADRPPRDAGEVHRELGRRLRPGVVKTPDGQHFQRQVYCDLIKYSAVQSPSGSSDTTEAALADVTSSGKRPAPEPVGVGRGKRRVTQRAVAVCAPLPQIPAAAVVKSPSPNASGSSDEGDEGTTQPVVLSPDIIKELAQLAAVLPSVGPPLAAGMPSVLPTAATPAGIQEGQQQPAGSLLG